MRAPIVDDGRVRGVEIVVGEPDRAAARADRDCRRRRELAASRARSASRDMRARPRRWAVGAYFEGVPASGNGGGCGGSARCTCGAERYIGIAPLPGGVTNACVVTADRAALARSGAAARATRCAPIAGLPTASRDARTDHAPRVPRPAGRRGTASGAPGLLLAGDAAGFIDPMTGDGLRFALRGGELAAQAALAALEHGRADAHVSLARLRRARVREQVALQSRAAGACRLATRDARRLARRRLGARLARAHDQLCGRRGMRDAAVFGGDRSSRGGVLTETELTESTGSTRRNEARRSRTKGRPAPRLRRPSDGDAGGLCQPHSTCLLRCVSVVFVSSC